MATHSPLLLEALRLHRAGEFAAAEAAYRSLLAATPDDPEVLHLLGLLAHRCGRHREATRTIQRAVALAPAAVLYRCNLARVLAAAGCLEEAARALRAAAAQEPANPDVQYELGVVLGRQGRPAEAAVCLRKTITLSPGHVRAHNNLGCALQSLGDLAEAEWQFREAIRHAPELAEAHANLGALLCRLGRPAEAEASLHKALALAPDLPEALNTLGTVLAAKRDPERAEVQFRRALAIDPGYAEANNNLGVLLTGEGKFDEALAALQSALQLRPDYAEAESNLGNVLVAMGRTDRAVSAYRRALAIAPDEAETRTNLGVALLQAGRFEEGWASYEWRFARRGSAMRDLPQPLWQGDDLGERVLLVHAEQGFGDTIQFCRFVPMLGSHRIVLEVPGKLKALLSTLSNAVRVVSRGEELPPADLHCPLLSLPHRLGTTLETIPAAVSYLRAAPRAAARWRQRLQRCAELKDGGFRVGLAWAGNPDYPADRRRSIAPAMLASLLAVRGVHFISLQPEPAPPGMPILSFPESLEDFADTAALIAALDLVISVDTATVHLAGALGKPVWLLNRFDSCWRWLSGRTDSPWYPTVRQFRQSHPGDWTGVLAATADALTVAAAEAARLRA